MIPTKADDETQELYVRNIVTRWNAATPEQIAVGRNWYYCANELAQKIAPTTRVGAGVLAALSPQKSWQANVKIAKATFASGAARGQVGNACKKADDILSGKDPLTVLPKGSKTWHFYRCIVDPSDSEAVVIDRHAHDIAADEIYGAADRGLSNPNRYHTLAEAYRRAAELLGEIPSVVQAVTWTVQVDATEHLPYRAGRRPKA